ncbi:MAG TPA: hypothetical protein VJS13_04955 [Pyrinomonadaceae bacterium]|nr:hypothetical protein [Pyrinomonadaceae bacterium]
MLTRVRHLPVLVVAYALICAAASPAAAQTSLTELQRLLHEKAAFEETDFAALQRGEPVVRSVPAQDKREVAVSGLVTLRANADEFLRSYRDGLTRKNNAAVMEIGTFAAAPTLADLESLTLEAEDLEDLKACVVGACELKLSAAMIQRFAREVDWQAPDYAQQATKLFKTMLVEYVKDYRTRGDAALIEYNDKQDQVRLIDEHQALTHSAGYLSEVLPRAASEMQPLEELLVWSKIKFGLKPVIAINHVTIYKGDREFGPQILSVSKQIYANHYFNSSLALTGFVTVAGPTSYLVYENRSRADGLDGPLGKLKRGMVQKKAIDGLKSILEHSKILMEGPTMARESAVASANSSGGWGRRLFGGIRPLLWFLIISALIALLALRNYEGKASRAGVKQLKPEQR